MAINKIRKITGRSNDFVTYSINAFYEKDNINLIISTTLMKYFMNIYQEYAQYQA